MSEIASVHPIYLLVFISWMIGIIQLPERVWIHAEDRLINEIKAVVVIVIVSSLIWAVAQLS